MRINFECSGGYLNLQLRYHVDTDELPRELAEELLGLVESSGFFNFQQGPTSAGFPDAISYKLSISQGGKTVSLMVNDATAGTLHPLLARLYQLALYERRKTR